MLIFEKKKKKKKNKNLFIYLFIWFYFTTQSSTIKCQGSLFEEPGLESKHLFIHILVILVWYCYYFIFLN